MVFYNCFCQISLFGCSEKKKTDKNGRTTSWNVILVFLFFYFVKQKNVSNYSKYAL